MFKVRLYQKQVLPLVRYTAYANRYTDSIGNRLYDLIYYGNDSH